MTDIGIHIERFTGRGRKPWYYRVVASNTQTVLASQGYSRKWNRNRAVKRLVKYLPGIQVLDV